MKSILYALTLLVAFPLLAIGQDAFFDDRDPAPLVIDIPDSEPVPDPVPDAEPAESSFIDERSGLESDLRTFERRLKLLENKHETLEGRVDKVEAQLQAILTLRNEDGTTVEKTVEIDHVSGFGDFEVPPGGKVVAVNGKPIVRSSMAATSTTRATTEFTVQPVRARTIRIFPRVFGTAPSSTCRIVNGVMVCQ